MKQFDSEHFGPGHILRSWLSQQGFTIFLVQTSDWGRQWMRKSQLTIFSEN